MVSDTFFDQRREECYNAFFVDGASVGFMNAVSTYLRGVIYENDHSEIISASQQYISSLCTCLCEDLVFITLFSYFV